MTSHNCQNIHESLKRTQSAAKILKPARFFCEISSMRQDSSFTTMGQKGLILRDVGLFFLEVPKVIFHIRAKSNDNLDFSRILHLPL